MLSRFNSQKLKFECRATNFNNTLLSRISALQKEQIMCDCLLIVRHEEFYCHKILLASCSDFFLNLFTRPDLKEPIEIEVEDSDAFKAVFNYFYTGELSVPLISVIEVFKLARIFKLKDVQEQLVKFLSENIDEFNVLDIRICCDNDHEISRKITAECDEFIHQNMGGILDCKRGALITPVHVNVNCLTKPLFVRTEICERTIRALSEFLVAYKLEFDSISSQTFTLNLNENFEIVDFFLMVNGKSKLSAASLVDLKLASLNGSFDSKMSSRTINLNYFDSEIAVMSVFEETKLAFKALCKLQNRILLLNMRLNQLTTSLSSSQLMHEEQAEHAESPTSPQHQPVEGIDASGAASRGSVDFQRAPGSSGSASSIVCSTPTDLSLLNSDLVVNNIGGEAVALCNQLDENLRLTMFLRSTEESMGSMAVTRCAASGLLLESFDGNEDEHILVMGGYNHDESCLDSCEIYRISSNSWTSFSSMPAARSRFSAYHNRQSHQIFSIAGSGKAGGLSSVDVFREDVCQWLAESPIQPMSRPRSGHCVVGNPGEPIGAACRLLVIGGRSEKQSQDTCLWLDCATNKWISGPSMLTPRNEAASSIGQGAVFVAGGISDSLEGYLSSCEMLDPRDHIGWRQLPSSLPRERSGARLLNLGGGLALDDAAVASSDWSTVSAGTVDNNSTVGAANWHLLLLGGCDNQGATREALVYDIRCQKWLIGPKLLIPRMNPVCVLSHAADTIYTVGGFSGKKFLASQEVWSLRSRRPVVPSTNQE